MLWIHGRCTADLNTHVFPCILTFVRRTCIQTCTYTPSHSLSLSLAHAYGRAASRIPLGCHRLWHVDPRGHELLHAFGDQVGDLFSVCYRVCFVYVCLFIIMISCFVLFSIGLFEYVIVFLLGTGWVNANASASRSVSSRKTLLVAVDFGLNDVMG